MCICVGVYVSTIKRKPLIGMTLNLAVVVHESLSKLIDFEFRRSWLGLGLLPADQKLCRNAAGH